MDEVHQTIGQILDGFCENHIDLFPAVELLKTCHEQLPAGHQTDFFKVLAERLQSEPIRFPTSANSNRSSHVLIIRAWSAFGPVDALPRLLFSLLRPDTREAMESWATMIGLELLFSLSSYRGRFSEAALATIKGQCVLITCDQSIGLTDSRLPSGLVEVSHRLESLVKKIEFDRNVVQRLQPQLNATRPMTPKRDVAREVAVDTASNELWKRFDQSLFELKLREPSRKMHEETELRRRKAQFDRRKIGQGDGVGLFLALVDSDLDVLREFLEKDIDPICREVWRTQGNSVTAEFLRVVILGTVFNTIEVRIGSIKWGIEEMAKRQRLSEDLFPVRTHLVQATDQLKSNLSNRYEIEARELEYRGAPTEGLPHQKPTAALIAIEWQEFHDRFMQLANEEEGIERAARKDRLLRAYCDYKKHPEVWAEKGKPEQGFFCLLKTPETGLWMLSDGVNENFQERFRALAAHAGVTLGSAKGTDPEDFWLHRLYLDLLENNSDQLFSASKEGGMILRVCVASATFCSRLERRALETNGVRERSKEIMKAEEQRTHPMLQSKQPTPPSEGFSHSPDYRSVTVRGKAHTLTARQAQMIEILHEAQKKGTLDVSIAYIQEQLETHNSRWQDTWRSNNEARKGLIKTGERRGTLRLNL